jgi:hypothetical protein
LEETIGFSKWSFIEKGHMAIVNIEHALGLAHAYVKYVPNREETPITPKELRILRRAGFTGDVKASTAESQPNIALRPDELRRARRAGYTGDASLLNNRQHSDHVFGISVLSRRTFGFLKHVVGLNDNSSE